MKSRLPDALIPCNFMPDNDDKSGAAQQQQAQTDDNGQPGDSEPKYYTDEQVQKIVGKRVSKLAATNKELLSRLETLEGAQQKPDDAKAKDPVDKLQKKIEDLERKAADAEAKAARAELDKVKIKMAKNAGLPKWFDPTLLPGNDPDEIESAIENILAEMASDEEEAKEERRSARDAKMRKGFGDKTPKTKDKPMSGDAYMDQLLLRSIGRGSR